VSAGLPPPFVLPACASLPRSASGDTMRWSTSVRAASAALPQGPSLRSELSCLGPSTLNRPHPPHLWAHPDFTALRLIRDALAVRLRLGDPQLVPCFHWHPLSTCRPLGLRGVHPLLSPSSSLMTLAFDRFEKSRHSHGPPPSDSRGETLFRSLTTVCFRCDLSICSPPCRS
jgi:hypothetical protein